MFQKIFLATTIFLLLLGCSGTPKKPQPLFVDGSAEHEKINSHLKQMGVYEECRYVYSREVKEKYLPPEMTTEGVWKITKLGLRDVKNHQNFKAGKISEEEAIERQFNLAVDALDVLRNDLPDDYPILGFFASLEYPKKYTRNFRTCYDAIGYSKSYIDLLLLEL